VVASPSLVGGIGSLNGNTLLAVDTSESVHSLRGALKAGARGFFLWPAEREALANAAARAMAPEPVGTKRARVIAVYAPRGGSGATFVATHLAAAIARRRADCVLVDLDLGFGDASIAIGVPADESVRTMADLLPLGSELAPRHVGEVLWIHPNGFRVLLAPEDPTWSERFGASEARSSLEAVRGAAEIAVLNLQRDIGPTTRVALELADRVVVVLQLDVMSFRAARRAIAAVGIEDRCLFVVNRAVRSEVAPRDVERVFGQTAAAVIPMDRRVPRAQDRGRLLPMRGRTGRAIDRLARRLLEETA
jgi:pilus assembly protein CpaE